MRTENSPGSDLSKYVFESTSNQSDFLARAIGIADGVPYQLSLDEEGRGTYFNVGESIINLLGVSPGELTESMLLGMVRMIIPQFNNIPPDQGECRKLIMGGLIQVYKADLHVVVPNGEQKWIRDAAVVIRDDKTGRVTGMTGIFFDITNQKIMQLQLENAIDKAAESDRLKHAFLNNLSHEIRTPLNAIVGFTTLLGEPDAVRNSRREIMDIITHSSDHLLEIVDDIVEISKIEAKAVRLILKETNLNQMLVRVYDRFKTAAAEKKIDLVVALPRGKRQVVVLTDGYKLFQSLCNIVSNAVKFTNEGTVEFGMSKKGKKIYYYINDTGIGIGEADQPRIFEPFYQAVSSITRHYEGTGLGLSIAKAYIELLGGQIQFESVPAKGSEFRFWIVDFE